MGNGIPFTVGKISASSEALNPGPLDQQASAYFINLPWLRLMQKVYSYFENEIYGMSTPQCFFFLGLLKEDNICVFLSVPLDSETLK